MLTLIGKIKSIHGVKGEIIISHELPKNFDFKLIEALMVELNPKSYIPFFIEYFNETSSDEIIIKFEEILNREEAIILLNKNIYAPPTIEIKLENKNVLSNLIGYNLTNQENNSVGIIEDIYMNSGQVLLSINYQNSEKLIPYSEGLIIEKNDTLKTLKLEIAEGLLEI